MKMNNMIGLILLALAVGTPAALVAQEPKDETYIYATYFYCDTANEDEADKTVEKYLVPAYDAAVAAGKLKAWGWMSHHAGGKWRRILYRTGSTVDGLLSADEAVGEQIDKAIGDAEDDLGKYCNAHDDYVWQNVAGGDGTTTRGKVGISVYHVCSMAEEDRIDELFKKTTQPLLEKAASEGKLSSWGWNSHVIGGKYRRLETMTAPDWSTLLNARAEIIAAAYANPDKAESAELDKLCWSHTDYLWDIVHEKAGS